MIPKLHCTEQKSSGAHPNEGVGSCQRAVFGAGLMRPTHITIEVTRWQEFTQVFLAVQRDES